MYLCTPFESFFNCIIKLQFLAQSLVSFLPIIFLAISTTIESLFAGRAHFVLSCFTLWSTTKCAFLMRIHFTISTHLQIIFNFLNMVEPLNWCIMLPWIYEINFISMNLFSRALLRAVLIYEIILIFFS